MGEGGEGKIPTVRKPGATWGGRKGVKLKECGAFLEYAS